MPRRALIVDDEPAVCQLIQGVLSSSGLDSLTLTKSADAIGYLRDEKFDVVLLDFSMSAPSGNLAQQARGSGFNQRTPIIIISDDLRPSAVSDGFEAGASFFLYKPIDTTRLQRLIRVAQGAVEQEKRRFRRVPVRSKVRLGSDQRELECETVDLSLNGMMVQSSRTVPLGSHVRVTLDMPNGAKPLLGTGAVMRTVGEHQMGIQFNLLRTDESGRLQEFLLPLIIEG